MGTYMGDCLSADEAAEFLKISRQTLWRIVKRGELPQYRSTIDRTRVFYKREDLEKILTGVEVDNAVGARCGYHRKSAKTADAE